MGSLEYWEKVIRDEAKKLIQRHQSYANQLEDVTQRRIRRSGNAPKKTVQTPGYWSSAPGFNPYKVLSRAHSIAYGIDRALKMNTYRPRPAVEYMIPKGQGQTRKLSVFQIADNAVSRVTFRALTRKNAPRLSSRCYAYRPDITLHDAIHYVSHEFRRSTRLFIAEFDFSKFFDNIKHDYIFQVLKQGQFLATKQERHILRSFLSAPTASATDYGSPNEPRETGIPQGTSVSLFLANIAASRLDDQLEGAAVRFARYADDTLIWSSDYGAICRAADVLNRTAQEMGVTVNFEKSAGIRILERDHKEETELASTRHVDFLGHCLSKQKISIRDKKIVDIKRRISHFVYTNLLEHASSTKKDRLTTQVDRDYVVMLMQIRRYLYGDISESRLRRYLSRTTPRIHYKGVMSFFPLVDDDDQLRSLDGWMLHTIYTSLLKRGKKLKTAKHPTLPSPHGLTPRELLSLKIQGSSNNRIDLRMPSLSRMGQLLRRASAIHGPNAIANVRSMHYYPKS